MQLCSSVSPSLLHVDHGRKAQRSQGVRFAGVPVPQHYRSPWLSSRQDMPEHDEANALNPLKEEHVPVLVTPTKLSPLHMIIPHNAGEHCGLICKKTKSRSLFSTQGAKICLRH